MDVEVRTHVQSKVDEQSQEHYPKRYEADAKSIKHVVATRNLFQHGRRSSQGFC